MTEVGLEVWCAGADCAGTEERARAWEGLAPEGGERDASRSARTATYRPSCSITATDRALLSARIQHI